MPNFDINSRFNKEANFSQVVFGEDGYVLETELNEMQHIQDEARASLIRESIPSGVLNYFEPTMLPTTPNAFKLGQEMKVNVNGQILTIPKDTMIQMNEPPTKDFQSVTGKVGYREDLVFLEAWKEEIDCTETVNKFGGEGAGTVPNTIKDGRVGVETTRRIQWKWRIRVVDDVDFNKYSAEGFCVDSTYRSGETSHNYKASPQGSLTTPIVPTSHTMCYQNNTQRSGHSTGNLSCLLLDRGLYIAYSDTLKTADGYSYAIPLFRVKRRNSGEFGVNNFNGANDFTRIPSAISFNPTLAINATQTVTVNNVTKYKVGQIYYDINSPHNKIYVINTEYNSNKITVENIGSTPLGSCGDKSWILSSNRPDNLFNNIVDQRDIIDLRHKVSLTGFNYQELLEENFDKLLRGELNTKEGKKMLKTYHGIRKTPIDNNTIYYNSFDGTLDAEVGGKPSINTGSYSFLPYVTGLGLKSSGETYWFVENTSNVVTLDLFMDVTQLLSESNGSPCIRFYAGNAFFRIEKSNDRVVFVLSRMSYSNDFLETKNLSRLLSSFSSINHIRVVLNQVDSTLKVYVDGTSIGVLSVPFDFSVGTSVVDGNKIKFLPSRRQIVCDVMISNIDRGDVFATLPKDFIDGYATISPAFTDQRTTYGDPLMSQFTQEVIKCSGETKKQFTVTKAGANWASGDTIKLKGLTREVITGVIDSDTALAKIIKTSNPSNTIFVDDVSKFAIGDTVSYFYKDGRVVGNYSIVSIDKDNKSITVSSTTAWYEGDYLIESTTSSSSPVLKYMNGTTPTDVVGTWTGLGTNECTFTFGTNANLTNQDLEIQYSLNAPQGQGGISEVLTETLGGEYMGVKLIKKSNLTIIDDFNGKTISNLPHCYVSKSIHTGLRLPSEFSVNGSMDNVAYQRIQVTDSATDSVTASINPSIPQKLFAFNLIDVIESKFGEIPSIDKAGWIRANASLVAFEWVGYGVAPDGNNKAYLKIWDGQTKSWGGMVTNTSSTPTLSRIGWGDANHMPKVCDDNGFAYLLVYGETRTTTGHSTIFTDYINVEVKLKTESGFDVLAPVSTRRDAGISGALLVRKETKEVRRYPLGLVNENSGVVTYGDYVPYQADNYYSTSSTPSYQIILHSDKALVTTVKGSYFTGKQEVRRQPMGSAYNLVESVVPPNLDISSTHTCKNLDVYTSLTDIYDCTGYVKFTPVGHTGLHTPYQGRFDVTFSKEVPHDALIIYPFIFVDSIDNNMYLGVLTNKCDVFYQSYREGESRILDSYYNGCRFKLKGSPLIKGVE